MTDALGRIQKRFVYGPFGARADVTAMGVVDTSLLSPNTSIIVDDGFTGHEQLDELGLVHMGGRVYDALIGRFLSADPHIQSPTSTQNFNRYSYVLNNPMKYTDPSGYFLKKLFNGIQKNLGTIIGVGLMFVPGLNVAATIFIGFWTGIIASQGNLKAGIVAGVSAGLFAGIGARYGRASFSAPRTSRRSSCMAWSAVAQTPPWVGGLRKDSAPRPERSLQRRGLIISEGDQPKRLQPESRRQRSSVAP